MTRSRSNPAATAPKPEGPPVYPASVDRLIGEFARLPGIGRRSAERLAHWVLRASSEDASRLSSAIDEVKKSVRSCRVCANFADGELCRVCDDPRRDRSMVLVVEQPRDLIALESTGLYRGLYHVLLGRISPLDGVGAGDLTVGRLLERIDQPQRNPGGERVTEVILGLNPTLEGDGTVLYLAEQLAARTAVGGGGGGVKVSRLARGLPTGGQIEMANRAVLGDAITGRRAV